MTPEIVDFRHQILTIELRGELTQHGLAALQAAAAETIRDHGPIRILILAEGFGGWEPGGAWDDFSFQNEFDAQVERMAIVGDRRWEESALMFSAEGLRQFPIRYFATEDIDQARTWISAS